MTDEEFMRFYNVKNGVKAPQNCSATNHHSVAKPSNLGRDSFWDWRDHNGVSPVKNQGHCGSCWTFSTVGALEAHELLKYKDFTPLSEQQLVDCAQDFDNHGCNGGLPSHAFEYVMSAGGISTETDYPYYAEDRNCTVDPSTYALSVSYGSINITQNDEDGMADAIFHHGPVSIAFQVVDGFRDYLNGTYSSDTCNNTAADVNHAVLAVGYGTDSEGVDYWIIKNSWGTAWGNQGYFNMKRGVNMCGVGQCNSYPASVDRIQNGMRVEPKHSFKHHGGFHSIFVQK
jgi:cathepsin H